MAENDDSEITVDRKLSDIFKEGFDIYYRLQSNDLETGDDEYQINVKKCIGLFENSTKLVSLIGMFSNNELPDEIITDHLKYLLLPFFLGRLCSKLIRVDRQETLKVSDVYYKDFLKRCEDYEFCPKNKPKSSEGDDSRDLVAAARKRNDKLQQYRMKKELDKQIELLKVAIEKSEVEDEIKRDFFMKLIQSSIIETKEEIENNEQELKIIEFIKVQQKDGRKGGIDLKRPATKPLKPIIITRDQTQKAVFGMGYPSLPVMSVDEFYEQRVREGIFPDPEKARDQPQPKQLTMEEKEELEKEETELQIEIDDEAYLARARAMDEHKDVVRRGDGNRHNRS